MVKRWTVGQSHFPRWAEGPSCETEATPEPINNMYKNHEKVWNTNTHLCVDLKTYLRSDAIAKADKNYQGVLCREVECDEFNYDEHFTFVETLPQPAQKRNPRVYNGQYITVTRRDDGSLRLNFKPLRLNDGFTVDGYALEVAGEIREALKGLVGE